MISTPSSAADASLAPDTESAGRMWARPSPITLRGPPSTCLRHASRPIGAEARCAGFAFRAMPQWWFCAQLAVLQFMSAAGLLGAVAEMWRPSGRGTRCPGFPTCSPAQGWWWCWLLRLIWGPTALAGHCLGRLVVNRHHGAVLRWHAGRVAHDGGVLMHGTGSSGSGGLSAGRGRATWTAAARARIRRTRGRTRGYEVYTEYTAPHGICSGGS
jgi:hypothetical protein